MTQERIQEITGFRLVGDELGSRGIGMLFGYPVEARLLEKEKHNERELILSFTTDQAGFKVKELKKILHENPELKKAVDVSVHLEGERAKDVGHSAAKPIETIPGYEFFVIIKASDATQLERLYLLTLISLEENLKELPAFEPPTTCRICGGAGSDTLANYNGALNLVHRACLEKHKEEVQRAFEEKELNPKTVAGLIGGIIGGVVGAVPALIALVFFHYFVGVLFAVIPLGTFFGWKLLGGKRTKATTVFTIIYTLVVSLCVWILAEAIMLRDGVYYEFGYEITIGESLGFIIEFLTEMPGEFMSYALTDFLFAFGFAIVGLWITWRYINKTDADTLAVVQAAFDEALPLEFVTSVEAGGNEPFEAFPLEEQSLETFPAGEEQPVEASLVEEEQRDDDAV